MNIQNTYRKLLRLNKILILLITQLKKRKKDLNRVFSKEDI